MCVALLIVLFFFCFFFSSRRRHTRFDCDWSSDVCSSDLGPREGTELRRLAVFPARGEDALRAPPSPEGDLSRRRKRERQVDDHRGGGARSEERRVGKECRSRWSPDDEKNKENGMNVWKTR